MPDDAPRFEVDPDDEDEVAWPPPGETAEQRAARLDRERVMIEEAEEDIRQGRVLSGDEARDWLRKWAAGERLPEDDEIDLDP